jgi:hypothetical protein
MASSWAQISLVAFESSGVGTREPIESLLSTLVMLSVCDTLPIFFSAMGFKGECLSLQWSVTMGN